MWTQQPLKFLPQSVVDHTITTYKATAPRYGDKSNAEWHFAALKRILDKREPDYRD
jgi:hypothetical protein